MEYILTPEGLGCEFMNTIRLKVNGGDSVVLGRNETTGLNIPTCPNFQFISRNHIELNVRGDNLYMKCISSQDMVVHLNGVPCDRIERKLEETDLICMLGVRQYFNYRVRCEITLTESPKSTSNLNPVLVDLLDTVEEHNNNISKQCHNSIGNSTKTVMSILNSAVESSKTIDKTQSYGNESSNIDISSVTVNTAVAVNEFNNNDNNNETTTTAGIDITLKTVPSAEDMLKTMVNKLLRQYECSICYETLACAVSLNPCGCCFCYTCIAGWVEDGNKHKPSSSSSVATNPFASFAQCPHCQAEFNLSGTLPNRLVDGAIREILTDLPTELTDWERRVKEGAEKRKEVNDSLNSSTTSSSSHSNMGTTMLTSNSNSSSSSATSHRTGSRGTINSFFNTTASPARPTTISRAAPSGRRPFGPQEVVELEDSQPMALRDALNMRREVFMHGSRIERSLNSRHTHSPATAGILRGTKRGRTEAMNNTTAAPVNVFDLTSQSQNNPFLARSSSSSSTTTTNGVPSTTSHSTRHTNRVNLG